MARSIVADVSIRIGAGVSTGLDPRVAAIEAGTQARAALGGSRADVACVFCSGAHLAAPEATLEGVHEALAPPALIGCGAGGVLGGEREIEHGTAVAVWAATLDEGEVVPFHAEASQTGAGIVVSGLPDLTRASGAILLPDPYAFPTDALLPELSRQAPGVPVLGGISSARTLDGEPALFLGEEVVGGAVGLRLDGVEILPCVSQGAAPVGPELTITAAEGHVIHELSGRPALECLRAAIEQLSTAERELVSHGLLLGIVVDGERAGGAGGADTNELRRADFLVRGLIGADPVAGTIAVGSAVELGAVVRLHARDARSADRDLRQALSLRREALGGARPAGALLFTCNSRGTGMFGTPGHDAGAIAEELRGAPMAGFFAAGEIGPVGGDSFLHGFTATVAVFAP
jgi:small ligand-binding sensory domain FIST